MPPLSYFEWLVLRGITVKILELSQLPPCNDNSALSDLMIQILTRVNHLSHLAIDHCSRLSTILKNYVQQIDHVTFDGIQDISEHDFISCLNSIRGLQAITFYFCGIMPLQRYQELVEHFPDLHTFVSTCYNGDEISSEAAVTVAQGCPKLRMLTLQCDLSDEDLIQIALRCHSLTSITLSGSTFLTDRSISTLAECCPLLETFSLEKGVNSEFQITKTSLRLLTQKCTGLKCFSLHFVWIRDVLLLSLAQHCLQLSELTLKMKERPADPLMILDETLMRLVITCKHLKVLVVQNAICLTDLSLHCIAKHLPSLTTLCVRGCKKISNCSLLDIVNSCNDLKYLEYAETKGTIDILIQCMRKCTSLRLKVGRNPHDWWNSSMRFMMHRSQSGTIKLYVPISNYESRVALSGTMLSAILTECAPHLISQFTAIDCPTFSDSQLTTLVDNHFTSLRAITLSECVVLTDVGLTHLVTQCRHLQSFIGIRVSAVTCDVLIALTQHNSQLNKLEISHCEEISDAVLFSIAQCCTSLTQLTITESEVLSDESVCAVVRSCNNIYTLTLDNCTRLSNAVLIEIYTAGCKRLMWLSLKGCILITSEVVSEFCDKHKTAVYVS